MHSEESPMANLLTVCSSISVEQAIDAANEYNEYCQDRLFQPPEGGIWLYELHESIQEQMHTPDFNAKSIHSPTFQYQVEVQSGEDKVELRISPNATATWSDMESIHPLPGILMIPLTLAKPCNHWIENLPIFPTA